MSFLLVLLIAGTPTQGRDKKQAIKGTQMKRNPVQFAADLTAAGGEDAEARRKAYLSLSKMGVEKRVPDAQPDDPEPRCVELPSSNATCKAKVAICSKTVEIDTPETHYSNTERFAGFGSSKATALEDLNHLFTRTLRSGPDSDDMQCNVVYLDGCHRRIGMVCTSAHETQGASENPQVETQLFDLEIK